MESQQLYGVRETVPVFFYQAYVGGGGKLERRKYDGHQRIVAAFKDETEASEYREGRIRNRNSRRGGYMRIHELEYRLCVEAEFDVVPVDVLPSVAEILY